MSLELINFYTILAHGILSILHVDVASGKGACTIVLSTILLKIGSWEAGTYSPA